MSVSIPKVLDISIGFNNGIYEFYVPIKTGSLRIKVKHEDFSSEFCEFLDTSLRSELRRFGENPVSK